MIIFALVAIAVSGPMANYSLQTIGYYSIISECQKDKNKIEPTVDKSYVRLDCIPVKVGNDDVHP